MNTASPSYDNSHLLLAGLLTAFQLFTVAALFNKVNSTYSVIMVANSIILPIIMAYKTPRKVGNLLPLFNSLFKLGLAGFFIAWLIRTSLPKALVESNPIILEGLSQLVAISATLPPSMIPFSVSLIFLVVVSGKKA